MKFLITTLLLVTMVASGLTSLHFFRETDYDLSSLLVITTYLSMVFGIYMLTVYHRKRLSH
jgi:hypothetical protein